MSKDPIESDSTLGGKSAAGSTKEEADIFLMLLLAFVKGESGEADVNRVAISVVLYLDDVVSTIERFLCLVGSHSFVVCRLSRKCDAMRTSD